MRGYGPVVADVARRVAATQVGSEWRVAVTHPDSGALLWDGTTKRRPSTAQRRYVEARSPTCVFPGCRMPATRSDIDHVIDHSQGGPTLVEIPQPAVPPRPPAQRRRVETEIRTRRHHHLDQSPRTHLHHRTRSVIFGVGANRLPVSRAPCLTRSCRAGGSEQPDSSTTTPSAPTAPSRPSVFVRPAGGMRS